MPTSRRRPIAAGDRVLAVINTVDDAAGGTLRALVNTSAALSRSGIDVTVTAPRGPHDVTTVLDEVIGDACVELFDASPLAARFGASRRQFAWLRRNIDSFDEVHIHSVFYLSALYTAWLARRHAVPYRVWPHGALDAYDTRKHALAKRVIGPSVMRPFLAHAHAILCTSDAERDTLVDYGATPRTAVIPLPLIEQPASPAAGAGFRARFAIVADAPVVLHLGRIAAKKGLVLALDVLAELRDERTVLVVVGDGTEDDVAAFRAAVHERDLGSRVVITGWLHGADKAGALAAANLLVLLSERENFGLAVGEAMAAGCPVLASREVDFAVEAAVAGAALVVDRSAIAAARAVDDLLSDADRYARLADAGRAYVQGRCGPQAFLDNLVGAERVHG